MLNISAAISYGWNQFKKMPGYFIGLLFIVFLIGIIPDVIQMFFKKTYGSAFIFSTISIVIQIVLSLGLTKIMLGIYSGSKPAYRALFSQNNKIFKYFLATILYTLIVVAGLLLFIVPGVIWAIKYSFYDYYIVDKDANIWESFLLSGQATMGNKWTLLGLGFVLGVINLLGVLCLGVGLFVTIPIALMAEVYAYKLLSGKHLVK